MAPSFSDFSQLKALKKDLEKKEAAADNGPKLNMTVKRPRVKEVKSREEMLGAQKARETGLKPGMRVTLMDTNDHGVIKVIWHDHVDIEIDGLEFPVRFNDFIVNDAVEDSLLRKSVGIAKPKKEARAPKQPATPSEITVDLHIEKIPGGMDAPEGFELPFQLEYFKRIIRQNQKHRGMRINVVHGVGDGILKDAIRKEIDETFALSCSWAPGIAGVTVVTIK